MDEVHEEEEKVRVDIPARFGEEEEELDAAEIEEDAVEAMMRWLESEVINSSPPSMPSSSEGIVPAFVTINGKDLQESCGSSFSNSASTVMASVDVRGVLGVSYFWPPYYNSGEASSGRWWDVAAPPVLDEDEEEWLASVLGEVGNMEVEKDCLLL